MPEIKTDWAEVSKQNTRQLRLTGLTRNQVSNVLSSLGRIQHLEILQSASVPKDIDILAAEVSELRKSVMNDIIVNFKGCPLVVRNRERPEDIVEQYAEKASQEERRLTENRSKYGEVDVDAIREVVDFWYEDPAKTIVNTIHAENEKRFTKPSPSWKSLVAALRSYYKKKPKENCELNDLIKQEEDAFNRFRPDWKSSNPVSELENYFNNKLHRGLELYTLGSFIKGKPLDQSNVIQDLQEQLQGKRILILGDDTGSMSEVISSYGGSAIGIEYDKFKVLAAHSGFLSESGKTQEQVIHGDIHDLTDTSSDLFNTLQKLGPFDIIYSHAVFNIGSGIEAAVAKLQERRPDTGPYQRSAFGELLTQNCMKLLSTQGFVLHNEVTMNELFDKYSNYSSDMATNGNVFIPKQQFTSCHY